MASQPTVDGTNPASCWVVYPVIDWVFYIPGGAGFLPSIVSLNQALFMGGRLGVG